MSDGAAGVAIVRRRIRGRIERRRLQHSRRKVNVIHLRVVIRIHRGRSHSPLAPVQRFADFSQFPVEFKLPSPLHVAQFISAHDFQLAVVAPFVGVANLVGHSVQLYQRLLLCDSGHPRQRVDVLFHRRFDFLHHLEGFLFSRWTEIFLHVHLAQRFS